MVAKCTSAGKRHGAKTIHELMLQERSQTQKSCRATSPKISQATSSYLSNRRNRTPGHEFVISFSIIPTCKQLNEGD